MKSYNTKQDMLPGNGLFQSSFHQWVIDGWRDIQTITTYQLSWGYSGSGCYGEQEGRQRQLHTGSGTTSSTQITASFIHNNWGGGAAFNTEDESWFAPGVFGKEGRNNYERAKYIVPFLN